MARRQPFNLTVATGWLSMHGSKSMHGSRGSAALHAAQSKAQRHALHGIEDHQQCHVDPLAPQ